MAFFEKFGETISTKGKEAAQKAKDMADIARLKTQIGQLEGKVKTWYQVIGEKVYQENKGQAYSDMEVEFTTITEAFAQIAELRAQIAAIQGLRTCPACKEDVDVNALFCPKCGEKLEEPWEIVEDAPVEEAETPEEASAAKEETATEAAAEDAEPAAETVIKADQTEA